MILPCKKTFNAPDSPDDASQALPWCLESERTSREYPTRLASLYLRILFDGAKVLQYLVNQMKINARLAG
jgi:hypothetical protein